MSDNSSKTICTVAVWIATSMIFTHGVFSFKWSGEFAGILWAGVALILAVAPVIATWSIWKNPSTDHSRTTSSGEPPKA